MDLSSLTESELQKLKKPHNDKIRELNKLIDEERKKISDIQNELNSRHKWFKNDLKEKMYSQLYELKDEISEEAYKRLVYDLNVAYNGEHDTIYESYHHRCNFGPFVGRIFFDLSELLSRRLNKIGKNGNYKGKKFLLKFEFDYKTSKIFLKTYGEIFSYSGKNKCYDFKISKNDVHFLSKMIRKHFKKEFINYEDIIPCVINTIKIIENEFDCAILGYCLSIV